MLLIAQNLLELVLKKYLNTNLRRYIVVGGFAYVSEMLVIFICVHIFNFSNVVAVAFSYRVFASETNNIWKSRRSAAYTRKTSIYLLRLSSI